MYIVHSGWTLPHWMVYIAWTMVLLVVLASSFFCILYSQQWGQAKAAEWLGAFFLGAVGDMLILDPIKVTCQGNSIERASNGSCWIVSMNLISTCIIAYIFKIKAISRIMEI